MFPVHRLTKNAGDSAWIHKRKSGIESSREYCQSQKETHSNEVIKSFSCHVSEILQKWIKPSVRNVELPHFAFFSTFGNMLAYG